MTWSRNSNYFYQLFTLTSNPTCCRMKVTSSFCVTSPTFSLPASSAVRLARFIWNQNKTKFVGQIYLQSILRIKYSTRKPSGLCTVLLYICWRTLCTAFAIVHDWRISPQKRMRICEVSFVHNYDCLNPVAGDAVFDFVVNEHLLTTINVFSTSEGHLHNARMWLFNRLRSSRGSSYKAR